MEGAEQAAAITARAEKNNKRFISDYSYSYKFIQIMLFLFIDFEKLRKSEKGITMPFAPVRASCFRIVIDNPSTDVSLRQLMLFE